MKRIILVGSVFLMLISNVFAETDKYYDANIAKQTDAVWKQILRCDKAVMNHSSTVDVNDCLKVIPLKQNSSEKFNDKSFSIIYLNIGVIYRNQGDTLNAYK